jgi:hypothetical protein
MALASDLKAVPCLIANGTSLSAQINLGVETLVGIAMDSGWSAAALTFQVSYDGGTTFQELQDGSAAITFGTPAASVFIAVDPTKWRGINCLKVRSGTSGAPVAQGADRNLNLIVRSIF